MAKLWYLWGFPPPPPVLMINFVSKPDRLRIIFLLVELSLWVKAVLLPPVFFRLETELENCLTYPASLWMSLQTAGVGRSWRPMADDVRGICFLYHLHLIINVVVRTHGSFYFDRRWNQNVMPLETSGAITMNWMKTMRQCGDLMQISVDCSLLPEASNCIFTPPPSPPQALTLGILSFWPR